MQRHLPSRYGKWETHVLLFFALSIAPRTQESASRSRLLVFNKDLPLSAFTVAQMSVMISVSRLFRNYTESDGYRTGLDLRIGPVVRPCGCTLCEILTRLRCLVSSRCVYGEVRPGVMTSDIYSLRGQSVKTRLLHAYTLSST